MKTLTTVLGLLLAGLAATPSLAEQATLPETAREVQIAELEKGETGFTSPWALCADQNSRLWLRIWKQVWPGARGLDDLAVTRVDGGWKVDASHSHARERGWELNLACDEAEPVVEADFGEAK